MLTLHSLLEEQAQRAERRCNREVLAFYVAASSWSGIRPVAIAESVSGNFQIVHMDDFFSRPDNIITRVVDTSTDVRHGRRLLCLQQETAQQRFG